MPQRLSKKLGFSVTVVSTYGYRNKPSLSLIAGSSKLPKDTPTILHLLLLW